MPTKIRLLTARQMSTILFVEHHFVSLKIQNDSLQLSIFRAQGSALSRRLSRTFRTGRDIGNIISIFPSCGPPIKGRGEVCGSENRPRGNFSSEPRARFVSGPPPGLFANRHGAIRFVDVRNYSGRMAHRRRASSPPNIVVCPDAR